MPPADGWSMHDFNWVFDPLVALLVGSALWALVRAILRAPRPARSRRRAVLRVVRAVPGVACRCAALALPGRERDRVGRAVLVSAGRRAGDLRLRLSPCSRRWPSPRSARAAVARRRIVANLSRCWPRAQAARAGRRSGSVSTPTTVETRQSPFPNQNSATSPNPLRLLKGRTR